MTEPAKKIRIDKWLWQARFFKTRSLSAKVVSAGKCRVNGTPVAKPAFAVGPEDVLTFPQADQVRVIKVLGLGTRRGPATEARELYLDLEPVQEQQPKNPGYEGKGRPDKKKRREIDLYRRSQSF